MNTKRSKEIHAWQWGLKRNKRNNNIKYTFSNNEFMLKSSVAGKCEQIHNHSRKEKIRDLREMQ
jgi:hypothetical protein